MIRRVVMFDRIWQAKGLWLRILFCWALGSTFPAFDEVKQYDTRFRLRGTQEVSKQIVMVYFDQEDWNAWVGASQNWLRTLKETNELNDASFWRTAVWNRLLGNILAQDPRSIGVSFVFNPNLPRPDETQRYLFDPRVIWAAQLDNEGRVALPLMATSYGHNAALVDLREDEDRVLRRFSPPLAPIPHMAIKLAESSAQVAPQDVNALIGESRTINYRGPKGVFPSISALNVLQGRVPPAFFKDKIVIIGSSQLSAYHTPVGQMARADVIAQTTDNVLAKRWIKRTPLWLSSIYLLAVLLLAVAVLTNYPQMVAAVFLVWIALGSVALSLWVFDSFYIWLPAYSALMLEVVAYVVFIGYQLSLKENQTWRLEQEKHLLSELDQLRNNFVSLISHDLKTPIAKIQAICDRLMTSPKEVSEEVREGLSSVRKESMELHRYIQSILQISRLESNKVQVRKEPIDFNEVVEKAVTQLRPLSQDKRQRLAMDLEPMFSIEADGVLIQEVILNLVENAVKYTPNDGDIQVQTNEIDDKVIFTVKDSGPGIPEQDKEHLFEKFFRGQAQQSSIKGTGLGLFLVKYFIELHGGEVFLESELGKGTRVGFTLPLEA
ncbi:MAG: CHASE2 domain-containing protein [Bdellovibrionales bacterium]|nr:CHASE2 domain-containing protein [Bdellovibrionales bacterium]